MIRRLLCLLTGHDRVLTHRAHRYRNGLEEHQLIDRCLRCGHESWRDMWVHIPTPDPEHQD